MKKSGKLPCGRPIPDWLEAKYTTSDKRFTLLKTKLDAFVSSQKLNKSDSRIQILEIVSQYESHFTPAELIVRVTKAYPKIGSATVYRNIQSFVQAGILRETFAKDTGEHVYEVESTKHHDHIVCLDCDAILEFHESKIEILQEKVLKDLGFREARHRHVIYAHCEYKK
jgi:Fur family ferric uptake transcriptional regulator